MVEARASPSEFWDLLSSSCLSVEVFLEIKDSTVKIRNFNGSIWMLSAIAVTMDTLVGLPRQGPVSPSYASILNKSFTTRVHYFGGTGDL